MLELRHYQRAALDSVYSYWSEGGKNPLVIVPTGGGKSLIIAALIKEILTKYPRMRIAQAVHVKELIQQNFMELIREWPQAPAGIYSASVGRRDAHSQVLFCGIQSVYSKATLIGWTDLLLVDEAHLIPPEQTAMYGKFINDLLTINPEMRIIGLTATGYRLLGGRNEFLTSGPGSMFSKVVYEVPLTLLIDEGYLVPPITRATTQRLNVDGVKTRGGEFIAGQLEAAVDISSVTEAAVLEMVEQGHDRKSWIAFCSGISHSEHVCEAIRRHGITCEVISSKTAQGDRDRILDAFKAGKIRALASMNVLTTGFNAPCVDLIAMLRPTKSTVLYVQMIGRGLRTAPGKTDCLVLDFAANIEFHGPVDLVKITEFKEREKGEAPVKICPMCKTYCHASASKCFSCAFEFPPPEPVEKITATAAVLPLLSREVAPPQWLPVQRMSCSRYIKAGSPDSLRIEFLCGLKFYPMWLSLAHGSGFIRDKGRSTWCQLSGDNSFPFGIDDALKRIGDLRTPSHIRVRPDGKYFEIAAFKFEAEQKEQVA